MSVEPSQLRELLAAQGNAVARQQSSNLYEEYRLCVELDGATAHPADEQWRDKRHDTANAVRGLLTLRFGILDLGDGHCQTADAVASVLRSRGWPGIPHPCSRPECAVTP